LKSYYFYLLRVSDFNLTRAVLKIKKPTLIIHGNKDTIFPLDSATEMHRRIKGSELCVIKSGHLPVLNNSQEIRKIIVSFIKSLDF